MLKNKSFSISTLGCKVNLFESEHLAHTLNSKGYTRTDDAADLCIINTCTVTAEADRQARQMVRRVIRDNPAAWVVVTGCYAQTDAQTCAQIPGVDLVVGNAAKLEIPNLLERLYANKLPPILRGEMDKEISLPSQLIGGFDGRVRAFLQIQQGCDQGCTFCIIHKARGPNRSFAAKLIRRQAERLIMNGYRELVICGVDIGSYGSDFSADEKCKNLTDLLAELITIEGDFRLRLSSIDPAHITNELINLLATSPRLCPQLHLSLQSANTLILKRMKRRATREMVYERIEKLRAAIPNLMLSADIMTGFPTETETQFNDTLNAVSDLEIAYPHVFAYSPRPGTPAARIPNQVPVAERKNRAAKIRARGKAVWFEVATRRIGSQAKVLIESNGKSLPKNWLRARAEDYFPVHFEAQDDAQVGDFADVKITAINNDMNNDSLLAQVHKPSS